MTAHALLCRPGHLLRVRTATEEVFPERSRALTAKAEQLDRSIEETKAGITDAQSHTLRLSDLIPLIRKVLNTYSDCPSPKGKNDLLRKVVSKAVYAKTEKARRGGDPGTFSLDHAPPRLTPFHDTLRAPARWFISRSTTPADARVTSIFFTKSKSKTDLPHSPPQTPVPPFDTWLLHGCGRAR